MHCAKLKIMKTLWDGFISQLFSPHRGQSGVCENSWKYYCLNWINCDVDDKSVPRWHHDASTADMQSRVGFGDEWWEIHLTWKTIQNAFSRILCTLRHFNQAKYTAQSCRSWKPCEMDLSHNCSLHGGRSEVCENNLSTQDKAYWIYLVHINMINDIK